MHRIGIDIVNNGRVRQYLSDSFLRHILSDLEMEEFHQQNNGLEYLAGRLAAKEAVLKCLVDRKITDITKICILNGAFGEPIVKFEDLDIQVSISHSAEYSVAVAIIE